MNRIKDFFSKYLYDSVKMFLDQVVLSFFFGFGLSAASMVSGNQTLMLICGIGSVVFYLVMIYSVAWKMGTTDRPFLEGGHRRYNPFTGTLVSLVANIPNFIVATVFMIYALATGGLGAPHIIALFLNSVYLGLTYLIKFNGSTFHMCMECEICLGENLEGFDFLHTYWWVYFLLILPAVLVSTVAYIMGAKGKMFTKLMVPDLPDSDRPTRKELKERKNEKRRTQTRREDDTSDMD